MPIFRLIPPKWALHLKPREGKFTEDEIIQFNSDGYNIYYFPNFPRDYPAAGDHVKAADVDSFNYVFVDYDCKSGTYDSKDHFIESIDIPPSKVVDSGNGIHVYWKIKNLDAKSYLRFQRRLIRLYRTDEAVCTLNQLMRYPETLNTKEKDGYRFCTTLHESNAEYTAEELDKLLPNITRDDETFCEQHYNKAHSIDQDTTEISEVLPAKFGSLMQNNLEAKEIFAGDTADRSKSDYRLGHLMFANGFTKDEALSVLVNSVKALERLPVHRRSYALNIVDKIWTFENADNKDELLLSNSVKEILHKSGTALKGTPFRCHPRIDNTERGFKLGHVMGLVAGSGVGKTAFALNLFQWFAQNNPDYHHFFVPLEQPANEIAERWQTMCGNDTSLHDRVHIISNYDDNGNFRHLSFDEIRKYVLKFQEVRKIKIGCIVIDHIGALNKKGKHGENQDIMDICHEMKSFAVQTNTFLVMQSQTSREKAGIGDLELNKDAAYGTLFFEAYCDFLVTLWQPLKRCHSQPTCPKVTAFKFCKIRHKKSKDVILEDVPYYVAFNPEDETVTDMTQDQKTSFKYFLPQAVNKRKQDRKTEIIEYQSVKYDLKDNRQT